MIKAGDKVLSGRWSALAWAGAAALVHAIFLTAVAKANGWSLQPLIEIHDGIYYVSHLEDPLLADPPEWWDNVPYRAIRFGYILVALPFRSIGLVPALVIANLIGVGVGAVAIRTIARRHGASENLAWLVWVINPAALVATALILPDAIAWTAILLTLLAIDDRRWAWAIGLAILAVITKEASIAALGLAGIMKFRSGERLAMFPVIAGVITHVAVLGALVLRFGSPAHSDFLSWPLAGWVGAVGEWISFRPLSGIVGVFVLLSGALVIVEWWRRQSFYLAAAAGQALLMTILSTLVVAPLAASIRIAGLFWPLLAATHKLQTDIEPVSESVSQS